MANGYSVADLINFLRHAGDKGLMPAATATSFAVATRNVFSVLDEDEDQDVRRLDLDAVIKRFTNKRARDFNPSSLKEYGRRARRAVDLFVNWRDDPANFTMKTRGTSNARKKAPANGNDSAESPDRSRSISVPVGDSGGYQSAFPIRPGTVVTVSNIPRDLTPAEAERLATFVRMLAIG